jgi:iron(III) transport system ATP-binding protein
MSALVLSHVSKRFATSTGTKVAAVSDISLDVADGELVALLGASGCGKSTLLRLVAGFETADAGTIRLGGRTVSGDGTHVPPEERKVGIVFQSYALWPHMDVAHNVGYALEVAGVKGEAWRTRVDAALATVGLSGYDRRRTAELSGGQRQRVALARCLAMDPAIVLLDEPLANLDVHLRASMLDAFAEFHAATRATMLYVTHDQAEAMALADRIAVMSEGKIVQFADPRTLYREPATAGIGAFVGRGTILDVAVRGVEGTRARIALYGAEFTVRARAGQATGPAKLCLRPEDMGAAERGFAARIRRAAYTGGFWDVEAVPLADPSAHLRLTLPDTFTPQPDAVLTLGLSDGWILP